MKNEEIELLIAQIDELRLKEEEEKKKLLVPFLNKRKNLLNNLTANYEEAKKGVEGYNAVSYQRCGNESVKVIFKPKEIEITPDFEEIFNENLEKILVIISFFSQLEN